MAVSVINEVPTPPAPPAPSALSWAFGCLRLLFHNIIFKLTFDISMRKIILIRNGILYNKYDLSNVKIVQKNNFILSRDDPIRPLFCFEDTKNRGLLIFNSLKENKLIFNFFVNRD